MANWLSISPLDRVSIFIDGANLYKTARNLGFDIDYKRLLTKTSEECRLVRASYYTAMQEDRDQDYSPLRPLVDWLDYNGYTMVTKVAREYTDASGKRRYKGSTDIELAVDMLTQAPHLDAIVLFTGNGEFKPAVARLQDMGIRVVIVSTIKTSPPMASDEVRRQADAFIDLADLEGEIGRKASPKKATRHDDYDDEYDDDYDDDYEDDLED